MAALAVALTLISTSCTGDDASRVGPVAFMADEGFHQTAYVHADGGQTVVFGATSVRNEGDGAATLNAGSLTGDDVTDDGANVAEVRVLDITGGGDRVGAALWPFEHYARNSVPLQGFELPPGGEVELLFVVKVDQSGLWHWPQTLLEYQSGGTDYETRTNTGFLICPRSADECDPPA
jgi:hypothetical protein